MVRFSRDNFTVAEFLEWDKKEQLVLQPKFQRRAVWSDAARSYLIDTIVRGFPMPKVYLRKIINPKTKLAAYEVVDGEQRLRAILDFHKSTLVLSKRHNPELGGVTFQGLPDPVQDIFLQYKVSTELMENASDSEVWSMFERLNSYPLTLNRQEKLNAEWFGDFKQTAYTLASQGSALEAWRKLRAFTNIQLARMKEVELTSDVLVAISKGISDITAIARAYEEFDPEFPKKKTAEETFKRALKYIADELAGAVRATRFRNRSWMYSLMVATADALIGIPEGIGPKELRPGSEVQKRMFDLDHELWLLTSAAGDVDPSRPLRARLNDLRNSLSRGTSHAPPRRTRHDHFFTMLTLSEPDWRKRWRSL